MNETQFTPDTKINVLVGERPVPYTKIKQQVYLPVWAKELGRYEGNLPMGNSGGFYLQATQFSYREGGIYDAPTIMTPNVLEKTFPGTVRLRELLDGTGTTYALRLNGAQGADPEIFVVDKSGELVPAWKVCSTPKAEAKRDCTRYDEHSRRMGVYPDGFALELLSAGSTCLAQLHSQFQGGLAKAFMLANAREHTLTLRNVFEIPPKVFAHATKDQLTLGCGVTKNAYGLEQLSLDGAAIPIRSAGGHMHFGLATPFTQLIANDVVKTLDILLGIPSVIMAHGIDDPRRRLFYGRAGEYRLPAHGIEYRVLSNFWLAHPVLAHTIWEYARMVFSFGMLGGRSVLPVTDQEVQDAVNNADVNAAKTLWARLRPGVEFLMNLTVVARNFRGYNNGLGKCAEKMYKLLSTPIIESVPNLENFVRNWCIGDVNYRGTRWEGTGGLDSCMERSKWYQSLEMGPIGKTLLG